MCINCVQGVEVLTAGGVVAARAALPGLRMLRKPWRRLPKPVTDDEVAAFLERVQPAPAQPDAALADAER